MNRPVLRGAAIAVAAVVALPLLGAAPALAAPQPDPSPTAGQAALSRIQTESNADIDRRLAALQAAIPAVAANAVITTGDKATLTNTLANDVSGLTALRQKIDADTTVAEASADREQIFATYRVYALTLPQVRFAAAADGITGTVIPAIADAQHNLEGLLAGVDADKNTPAVQAKMADLANQLATITSLTSGLAQTVLSYTPAQYNANHALLAPARSSLAQARTAIAAARADIVSVTGALA